MSKTVQVIMIAFSLFLTNLAFAVSNNSISNEKEVNKIEQFQNCSYLTVVNSVNIVRTLGDNNSEEINLKELDQVANLNFGIKPIPPIGCKVGVCMCDQSGRNCRWTLICG